MARPPRNNPDGPNPNLEPPSPLKIAGIGRRLASLCYEVLLLTAILFVSGWAFLVIGNAVDPLAARPLLQVWLLAVSAVYFVFSWTHTGQTLPMKTWRIRVLLQDGRTVDRRHAIGRFLGALLSLGLCGSGWLWAFFDADRQFLHDRLAGTRLVEAQGIGKRTGPANPPSPTPGQPQHRRG